MKFGQEKKYCNYPGTSTSGGAAVHSPNVMSPPMTKPGSIASYGAEDRPLLSTPLILNQTTAAETHHNDHHTAAETSHHHNDHHDAAAASDAQRRLATGLKFALV